MFVRAAILLLAVLLTACGEDAVDTRGAHPRVVQARGALAESEQATIAIFETAAPSVVMVISAEPSLAQEAHPRGFRAGTRALAKDLDGDVALEERVEGAMDIAHSTPAEQRIDPIAGKPRPHDSEG